MDPAKACQAAERENDDGKPIVHVVSPDAKMREELRAVLEESDCLFRSHPSVEAFLSELRPGGTGCLVMELQLPGVSGALLQRLRESRLPVIVISGEGSVRSAVGAMRAGAAAYIEKPYAQRMLLNEIRHFLG